MPNQQQLYRLWMENTRGDAQAQGDLAAIAGDEEEIFDRFYRELSFGTAGLRGVLGMGTNRMNRYVVGRATQGLANCVRAAGGAAPAAAIAYDSRHGSREFARHAACVFAANGVKVHLYRELMPTPALSYAVRELGCATGVVITASHNPAAYNGYKAYGPDGCQIGPEQAEAVQKEILATDLFSGVKTLEFDQALEKGLIEYIPQEFVEQYIHRVFAEALEPRVCREAGLRLVYTPLNGAGRRCVTAVLEQAGITEIHLVKEQELPDGDFPTCPYPNPEAPAALELGLALCRKVQADLLLATDPDSDRVAIAARQGEDYRLISGNELGLLLLDYLCKTRQKLGKMPNNPVAVRSLVSSPMTDRVAEAYGVELRKVLTGFKYVGETIAALEAQGREDSFIFAFEESCGYMTGSYVRDKDAVNASLLVAEMASAAKLEGKTLADKLEELYSRFGCWRSEVDNFAFEGAAGMEAMANIMNRLRQTPPRDIAGDPVERFCDYQENLVLLQGVRQPAQLPKTNMIELRLGGNHRVIIRPSGTEPKIKVYYTLVGESHRETQDLAERYRAFCKKLILA